MDKGAYIARRRKRYLAQILDEFETRILPHLPDDAHDDVTAFKASVRRKMSAYSQDVTEIVDVGDTGQINGLAVEVQDRTFPHGRTRSS